MIKFLVVYSFGLSSCRQFFISSYRNGTGIFTSSMDVEIIAVADESDIPISCEEIVKTRKRMKNPNPKWYNYLLKCLKEGWHKHMLSYVRGSNGTEFTVVFTDRKNKKNWKPIDISLFKDLDEHIRKAFNRPRSMEKFEENVKIRFKSNMSKCIKRRFVKEIGKQAIQKYKIVKKYKILWRPDESDGEGSNDKRVGKNKRKTNAKGYRKNSSKETSLSRGNFEEKTANFESVSQTGHHENMNIESIPQTGNHENMNIESIPQIGNHENMNIESIPQMGNPEIMNFVNIPQIGNYENMNIESIPQMGNNGIMNFASVAQIGNHEIKNFESIPQISNHEIFELGSMAKEGDEKKEIVENNLLNRFTNLYLFPQEGESKIHLENVHPEDISITICQHSFEEKPMNVSHYPSLSANPQITIDRNEHVDYGAILGDGKASCPVSDLDFSSDSNILEVSENPVNMFCENSDVKSNIRDETAEKTYWIMMNDVESVENQGNQYIYDDGKYIVDEYQEKEFECINLESDPFMSNGQFQKDFNSLEASDDWSCNYQELSNILLN